MRLKTFHASSMKEAMEQVRDLFGEDAIIISTKKDAANKSVTVTAARDEADPDMNEINDKIAEENLYASRFASMPDYIIKDVEEILLKNGVSEGLIKSIISEVRQFPAPAGAAMDDIASIISEAVMRVCEIMPYSYTKAGARIILVGPPGAGKTLTAAKLAARVVKAGFKINVITTDFKRAGGVEQLAAFTDILNTKLHVASTRKELKDILSTIPEGERVIVDSPGANPYEFQELKELGEFAGLMELTPILVFPAGGDPHEAEEVAQAFSFLGVEYMIVSRLDLARRYGSFLSAAFSTKLRLSHITGTEKVLGDFNESSPNLIASLLCQHRR